MQRVGMTWQVDPAHWDAYKAIHLNPWPELIEAIQAHGIHNYSIFAFGTRVFAYMEVDDGNVQDALARLSATEIKQRWDAEVTTFVMPEAVEGSSIQFMQLEPIFFCA
jgi:L-rhamnose mutarotase